MADLSEKGAEVVFVDGVNVVFPVGLNVDVPAFAVAEQVDDGLRH